MCCVVSEEELLFLFWPAFFVNLSLAPKRNLDFLLDLVEFGAWRWWCFLVLFLVGVTDEVFKETVVSFALVVIDVGKHSKSESRPEK